MKQVKNSVWLALFMGLFFCQNDILAQGPFECNGQYYLTINPASESIIYEVQINPLNGNIDFPFYCFHVGTNTFIFNWAL